MSSVKILEIPAFIYVVVVHWQTLNFLFVHCSKLIAAAVGHGETV